MDIVSVFKSLPVINLTYAAGWIFCTPVAYLMGWIIDDKFAAGDFYVQLILSAAVALMTSTCGLVVTLAGYFRSGWARISADGANVVHIVLPGVLAGAAVFGLYACGCRNAVALKCAAAAGCAAGMALDFWSMMKAKEYYDKR